jgi:hypothetical protein
MKKRHKGGKHKRGLASHIAAFKKEKKGGSKRARKGGKKHHKR